jgi:DNA-binding NtrC family response regulator
MLGLLIADDDVSSRVRLASFLTEAGYDVLTTDSAANVIEGILKNMAKVVILGGQIGGLAVADLLPILKKCKADLKVIIASEEASLPVLRKLRREGIFYHLVKPLNLEDWEEVQQVVRCAFENLKSGEHEGQETTA